MSISNRAEFNANAKPVTVTITAADGKTVTFTADAREFSTGSCGWNINGKATVEGVPCQVGMNLTVIGSKTWAK